MVAGWSETPGHRFPMGSAHTKGVPELCDPCGVGLKVWANIPGASLRLAPGYHLASLRLGEN